MPHFASCTTYLLTWIYIDEAPPRYLFIYHIFSNIYLSQIQYVRSCWYSKSKEMDGVFNLELPLVSAW